MTGIMYLQNDSKTTLFAPNKSAADYRMQINKGGRAEEAALKKLAKDWDSICYTKPGSGKGAKKPNTANRTPCDDMATVYGLENEAVYKELVPAGTFQLENPIRVHKAPAPLPPVNGAILYRRVVFMAWDHHRLVNCSLTTVFYKNFLKLWTDKSMIEANPQNAKARFKRKKPET